MDKKWWGKFQWIKIKLVVVVLGKLVIASLLGLQ